MFWSFTFFSKLCNSCGWSFCISPICSAAALRVTGVDPHSNNTHNLSNLVKTIRATSDIYLASLEKYSR